MQLKRAAVMSMGGTLLGSPTFLRSRCKPYRSLAMSVTEPPVTTAAPAAPAAPTEPVIPEAAAPSSKAWLGWLVGFVVVALLAGATAVLFVRVHDAQQQADAAVAVAGGNQAQIQAQLEHLDRTLTQI